MSILSLFAVLTHCAIIDHMMHFDVELARASDRIVNLILYSDLDWVDIAIEENALRQKVQDACPEKIDMFERIYASRFRRIWRQWREV